MKTIMRLSLFFVLSWIAGIHGATQSEYDEVAPLITEDLSAGENGECTRTQSDAPRFTKNIETGTLKSKNETKSKTY